MAKSTPDFKAKIGIDGEKEYAESLSTLRRGLTVLRSEMNASQSAFGKNADSVEALTAKQEALQKQYGNQQESVNILAEMLEKVETKYGANSKEADEMRIKLNNATKQMNNTKNALDKTGDALEQTTKDEEAAAKSAETLKKAMQGVADIAKAGLGAGLKVAAAGMAALGAAAAAATGAAFSFATGAGTMADDVVTLSQQTGISAKTLQEWTYASNFVDTSVETITGSMTKMIKNMGDAAGGSETAKEKFAALGVATQTLDGSMRNSEDVFWDAIEALGKIENETERDARAMEIFGKSAKELNPLILAGRDAFEELGDEAHEMGVVFSDDALAALGAFDDSMQAFNATGDGLKNAIGLTMIPAFKPLVDTATGAMARVSTALQDGLQPGEMDEIIGDLLGDVESLMGELGGIIEDALPLITEGLGALISGITEQLPAFLENTLPQLVGSLASLIGAIASGLWDAITTTDWGAVAMGIWDAISAAFGGEGEDGAQGDDVGGGILETIMGGLQAAASGAMDLIAGAVGAIWDAITSALGVNTEGTSLGTQIIDVIVNGVTAAATGALNLVKTAVSGIWDAIKGALGFGGEGSEGSDEDLGGAIVDKIVGGLQAAVSGALSLVTGIIGGIWDAIKSVFFGGEGSEDGGVADMGDAIIGGFISGLQSAVSGALSIIGGIFTGIWDAITGALTGGGEGNGGDGVSAIMSVASGLLNGLIDGFNAVVGGVIDAVGAVFGRIWDAIKGIFGFGQGESEESKEAKAAGKDIMTGISDGITGQESTIKTTVQNASKKVLTEFRTQFGIDGENGTSARKTKPYGQALAVGISDGVKGKAVPGTYTASAGDLATAAGSAFNNAFGIVGTGLLGLGDKNATKFEYIGAAVSAGIAKGITDNQSKITTAATAAANAAYNAAKTELDIHSPSRVMAEIGRFFDEGFAAGIEGNMQSVADSARTLSSVAAQSIEATREGAGGLDYGMLADAIVRAMASAGMGTMVVDGKALGRAVEPGVSNATHNRATQSAIGRSARLAVI